MDDRQGRNRPATTSEKRISAAFCVILSVLLLLLLSGCAFKQYLVHEIPAAGNYDVCLKITMTETVDEAQKLCDSELDVARSIACAEYPRADMNAQRVIFWRPISFNDALTLQAIGHEIMHTIGAKHE